MCTGDNTQNMVIAGTADGLIITPVVFLLTHKGQIWPMSIVNAVITLGFDFLKFVDQLGHDMWLLVNSNYMIDTINLIETNLLISSYWPSLCHDLKSFVYHINSCFCGVCLMVFYVCFVQ